MSPQRPVDPSEVLRSFKPMEADHTWTRLREMKRLEAYARMK